MGSFDNFIPLIIFIQAKTDLCKYIYVFANALSLVAVLCSKLKDICRLPYLGPVECKSHKLLVCAPVQYPIACILH